MTHGTHRAKLDGMSDVELAGTQGAKGNGIPRRMVISAEMVERAKRTIRDATARCCASPPDGEWSVDELLWHASRCIDVLRIDCGGLYRVAEKVRAEMPRDEFDDLVLKAQLSAMQAIDEGKDPCAFEV